VNEHTKTSRQTINVYHEQSSYSTRDFFKRDLHYFVCVPHIIQTVNGFEVTYLNGTDRIHPFDIDCDVLGIAHKLIRPRVSWQNGKVERNHRNEQESFYSYEDIKVQMKRHLNRSDNIPVQMLAWMSPLRI